MKLSFFKLGKFFSPSIYALSERASSKCDVCGFLCDSHLLVHIVGWHGHPSGWDEVVVALQGGRQVQGKLG